MSRTEEQVEIEDKPNMTQERNTSCNIEEDDSMLEDDLFSRLDRKYKNSNTETKWKLSLRKKKICLPRLTKINK